MRAALVALVLAACQATPLPQLPDGRVDAVELALDRTVFLPDPGCTGVRIARNHVVTAKHCLKDNAKVNDMFATPDPYGNGLVVSYISEKHDFALLVGPIPVGPDHILMRPARLGEHVYVVGFPMQLWNGEQRLTVTDGVAAGPVDDEGLSRITAPVYFGNSGGGVWGDDGALVGLAVAIYAVDVEGYRLPVPYDGQAWMVPIEHVLEVL